MMAEMGSATAMADLDKSREENVLRDRLYSIEDNRSGVYSVHLRLSELRPGNRKPHYIQIAKRAFEAVSESFNVSLYEFLNCDLMLLCSDVPVEELDPFIAKVRSLFSEDPLTHAEEGSIDDIFATWYDLAQDEDYASFVALVNDLVAEADEIQRKDAEEKNVDSFKNLEGEPLNPQNLAVINDKLGQSKISDLIIQQSAVQIQPDGKGKLLFRENFVSMSGLQQRVAPTVNLFGSIWLFQYLTENLDRRVLSVIGRRDFNALDSALSINLNLSTILSKEFKTFHRHVAENTFKVVVELQMVDIFSDMGSFFYTRDFLKEHGYRILVDGLNPLSLQYFRPGVLKADYVKIGWGQEFLSGIPGAKNMEMKDVIDRIGKHKVILGRVDSEKAIVWALTFGVTRFQGHYIDTIVQAMNVKGIL